MSNRGCTNCAPCCVCGEDSFDRDQEIEKLRAERDALRVSLRGLMLDYRAKVEALKELLGE